MITRRRRFLPALATVATVLIAPGARLAPAAAASETVQPNSVHAFGVAPLGDLAGQSINQPVVGITASPDRGGYWLLTRDGGVFTYGDAGYSGSVGNTVLNEPMVGMAADGATGGYWTVASDGGVFSFNSPFHGSTGNLTLNKPIVGMAATPDGGGYWLVASDGGIFTFGDAPFFGSAAAVPLNQPVVGMAVTPDGAGYWLAARDGGIFTYGDAPFAGSSLSGVEIPAVGLIAGGSGYRVAYGHAPSPLGPSVTNFLSQRAGTVTAALYDANTGLTWTLNPSQVQVTASIIKVDIMATAFEEAEQAGQPVPPPGEQSLMYPMIEVSDNNAATALWNDVGGPSVITAYNRNFGLTATTPSTQPITPTVSGWAFSTTSATDQLKVVSAFAFHNAVLSDQSRAYGLYLMEHVDPYQVWGIPAGAPQDTTVAIKTGNYPLTPTDYQVNSVGYLSGGGQHYVFAILTTGNPDEGYGISTINALASLMYDTLAAG